MARMVPVALAALLAMLATACSADRSVGAPEVRVSHLPPDETDIIEALIRSEGVTLTVHRSCRNPRSDIQDSTIGRYISSLLAFQERGGENWVEVTITPRRSPAGKLWRASVMFNAGVDESSLNYGVQFLVWQADGRVIASSFSCPGLP